MSCFSNSIDLQQARSPAIAAIRSPAIPSSRRPIAANASDQRAARSFLLAHVRAIEALPAEAIASEASLVGNPLLVHVVVDPRQDA